MPVVLSVPSPGGTRAERAMLVDVAWKSLADKGYGRQVGLDPRLIRYLRLLAKPDREVDARLWLDRPTRALAATADGLAILVVKADNKLIMREASPAGMPRAVLSVVPERAAGPGESVALPTAVFEAAAKAASTRAGFEMALRQHGVRDRDAAALTTMIGDVLGQGQFGAAARDRWGARHRAGHVISFFDTPDGRYVQVRKSSVSGEPWSTIAPVDHRRLLQHITAMLDEVAGATTR
ncbi:MAG: ESX secretion-associated protein EspG [Sciscionella sp.]|nr:ESX secretion-associated protein EspG [Sciscionella sp.]